MRTAMKYTGIDIHKRYSVCTTQDEQGRLLRRQRIEGNLAAGFVQFFRAQGGSCRVAIDACWNWRFVYDTLEDIPEVEGIVVSHPLKNRLIAEAQIKTDAKKRVSLLRFLACLASRLACSASNRAWSAVLF